MGRYAVNPFSTQYYKELQNNLTRAWATGAGKVDSLYLIAFALFFFLLAYKTIFSSEGSGSNSKAWFTIGQG